MRISIDSNESLEDVIRVVGAAYNVTLTVSTTNETDTTNDTDRAPTVAVTAEGGGSSRAATVKGTRAKSSRRSRPAPQVKASNDVLRSWARENGYTVSDRGRIPNAVVAAHREAQDS